jgi:hypothetical protein
MSIVSDFVIGTDHPEIIAGLVRRTILRINPRQSGAFSHK